MKMLPCALAVLSSFALVNAAYSQLAITSNIQSTTITFGDNLGWEDGVPDNSNTSNDVYRRTDTGGINPAGNARWLLETTAFSTSSGDFGFSSRAVSIGTSGNIDFDGTGPLAPNQSTFFGDDFNGDADTVDNYNVWSGATSFDSTNTYGIALSGADRAIAFGTNGAPGSGNYTRPFRDYSFTLRVQNVSGAAINQWSTSMDAWWGDDDTSNATMSLRWSTDLTNWTTLDSFTTSDAGDTTQLLTERDFAPVVFNANVADGSYLYLQIANLRPNAVAAANGGTFTAGSGSGAALAIDNWNITAIPEPSTVAFFASALAGLAYLFFRNRRK